MGGGGGKSQRIQEVEVRGERTTAGSRTQDPWMSGACSVTSRRAPGSATTPWGATPSSCDVSKCQFSQTFCPSVENYVC